MWDTVGTVIYFVIVIILLPILFIIYVIGALHDLHFINTYYDKVETNNSQNCPYLIELDDNGQKVIK